MENINLETYQICFNGTRAWPILSQKLIVGIFIFIFSVISFLLNLFIVSIIVSNYQKFVKQSTIYILLLNCCISHCIYLPSHFIISLPGIISSSPIYSNTLMLWLSSPHTFGYYLILFSNFFIAIDRFFMLFFEHQHFSYAKFIAYFFVFAIWFLSFLITVLFAAGECHKRFNQWTMSFNYGCNGAACSKPFIFSMTYDNFLLFFGQFLCFIMFLLYFLCFLKLINLHSKQSQSSSQRNVKGHIKVIIQFFTIFLAQWSASSFMVVLPYVSIGSLPTTLISNSAGLINAQANATLLLLFNRNLRKAVQGSMTHIGPSVRIIQTKVTPFSGMHQRSVFQNN